MLITLIFLLECYRPIPQLVNIVIIELFYPVIRCYL